MADYAEYLLHQLLNAPFEGKHDVYSKGVADYIQRVTPYLQPASRILEIGCGDGTSLALLRHLGFTRVIGVDYNPGKLAVAVEHGYPVARRDMHDLDCFADSLFDAVISAHTVEHALDPVRLFRECFRVLVPGGQFLFVVPFVDQGDPTVHVASEFLGLRPDGAGLPRLREVVECAGFVRVSVTSHNCCRSPEAFVHAYKP